MTDIGATLGLYCTALNSGAANHIRARFVNTNGTGIIQQGQASSGADFVSGQSNITTTGWLQFDVTSEVQSAIDNGYDWVVFNVYVTRYYSANFVSGDNTDPQYAGFHPQLNVVPEPLTAGLLGLGAILIRRRFTA